MSSPHSTIKGTPGVAERHADHEHRDACCDGEALDSAPVRAAADPAATDRVRYRILKMDCPTEERLIRNKLEPIDGVVRLDFDLLERELTVHHRLNHTGPIDEALNALDMAPQRLESDEPTEGRIPTLTMRQKVLLALSGMAAFGAELITWRSGTETSWPVIALAIFAVLAAGLPTLKKGWIAVSNFTLNIYFLMSLAVIGAVLIGEWPEAAMVIFLFAVAETVEALSLTRARDAIRSLTTLAPETVEAAVGDGWADTPVGNVAAGTRIRVRTGARVGLDARVVSGRAVLDQAPITGESVPVDKVVGDPLYAGSIVTDGVVEAQVIATAGESTLARIAKAIQQAQAQRAPTQRFVDQFARYYTPAVVALALLVAIGAPFAFGGTQIDWIYRALVLLVIACPCALVISTPVTVVSGLAAAARRGILIKGGVHLENGRKLRAMAMDKTGTLTVGRPVLTDAMALTDLSGREVLRIAASLDDHSTHPIAKAIVAGWRAQYPTDKLDDVADFSVLHGRGVAGTIDGCHWRLGNHRFVEELGFCSTALEERLATLEDAGKTAIVLCNSGPVAVFGVADTVPPESATAVAALRRLGVTPVMLSGDNAATVRAIATQVGIDDARGDLLPEHKLDAVADLRSKFDAVGMVGDGVNDAPALARADIGFAMGAAGTATALELPTSPSWTTTSAKCLSSSCSVAALRACCGRTSPWRSQSKPCFCRSRWSASRRSGWRCSPTWARA